MTASEIRMFCHVCSSEGLPTPVLEYMFGQEVFGRNWRADFFFDHNGIKLSVEVEGIFYNNSQGTSRHQTGKGYKDDMQKYNACSLLGIKLLRFTSTQALKQPILCCKMIKVALGIKEVDVEIFSLFALPVKKSQRKKTKNEK